MMRIPYFRKKTLFTYLLVLSLAALLVPASSASAAGAPVPNPFLSSPLYGITHFDSSQSDSTPYGPPRGTFHVDPTALPISYGGPVNIITLASTDSKYMWAVAHDKVSYVRRAGGAWKVVAAFEALADASSGLLPAVPDAKFKEFGESSAVGKTVGEMDAYLTGMLGANYRARFGNGSYSVVDKDNVLYANYGNSLYAFALKDPANPSAGIVVKHKIANVIEDIQGSTSAAGSAATITPGPTRLFGLSMTYDGFLVVTFSNGVSVIKRDFDLSSKVFYPFGADEYVSNSMAVDERNGMYIASNKLMRKLVWTGTTISDREEDGAWASLYDVADVLPPIIKFDNGTGSTPTLMGFGDDPDKLVVITDGAKNMKLVAFWRDAIPEGFVQKPGAASRRIAGQIQATFGLPAPLPEWLQSEQSVVVSGYGAFVVNNMPTAVDPALQATNKICQVSLMGPAYPGPLGVERFEWNPAADEWRSVWSRPDVSSTSMVPVHSQSASMALVNGYYEGSGWEVTGLDWNTGETIHRTVFGSKNLGNGAYAIIQYLSNEHLLFNSIVGPFLVKFGSAGGGCSVGAAGFASSALLLIVPLLLAVKGKKW